MSAPGATSPAALPTHGGDPAIVEPVADRPGRSRWVVVGVLVAVIAVVAAGVFAIVNLTGSSSSGGAASPEELGSQLLASIDDEDVLGAIDLLVPGERRTLGEPFVDVVDELQRLEVLADTDLSAVTGIDVQLSQTRVFVRPTNVTDIVNVDMGADAIVTVDGSELPIGSLITDSMSEEMVDELRNARESESESLDFWLTAVEHDGRWYFSLLHSIAEVGRRDAEGDLAIPTRGVTPEGAESPDGAIELLFDRIADLDLTAMLSTLDPDEAAALQRYAPLFLGEAESAIADVPLAWEIVDRRIRVDGSGGARTAFVDGFTLNGTIDGESFTLAFGDGCVRVTAGGETLEQCESDAGIGDFEELLPEDSQVVALVETIEEAFSDMDESGIEVRERDGEWFVSPIGTMSEAVLNVLRALDRDEIDAIVDAFEPAFDELEDEFIGDLDELLSDAPALGDDMVEPTEEAAESVDEVGEADGGFDADPEWYVCYDQPDAASATTCFTDFVAMGVISEDVVPIELRYPECGYAELRWSGDVYGLPDDEFVAAVTPVSECFLDLVERGEISILELPNEVAFLDCFEGRNWFQVFDDPEYDERYYACIDERLEG